MKLLKIVSYDHSYKLVDKKRIIADNMMLIIRGRLSYMINLFFIFFSSNRKSGASDLFLNWIKALGIIMFYEVCFEFQKVFLYCF